MVTLNGRNDLGTGRTFSTTDRRADSKVMYFSEGAPAYDQSLMFALWTLRIP